MNQWRKKENVTRGTIHVNFVTLNGFIAVTGTVAHLVTTDHKKNQLTILNMRPINTRYSKAAMMLVTKIVLSVLFNNAVDC